MEIAAPSGFTWKDDSIFVYPSEWLVNDIDLDGFYRLKRGSDNRYVGKKAKVIGVEPLSERYSAVHIAAWVDDDRSAKKGTN